MSEYTDGDVKIGAPSRGRRNRWLVFALGGAPGFAEPTAPIVRELYLSSPVPLQPHAAEAR